VGPEVKEAERERIIREEKERREKEEGGGILPHPSFSNF